MDTPPISIAQPLTSRSPVAAHGVSFQTSDDSQRTKTWISTPRPDTSIGLADTNHGLSRNTTSMRTPAALQAISHSRGSSDPSGR